MAEPSSKKTKLEDQPGSPEIEIGGVGYKDLYPRLIHSRISYYLSIESVQVKHIAGDNDFSDIYGTIQVDNSFNDDDVYNRDSSNPERKRVGDFLTLTGPNIPLLATEEIEIEVDLYDQRGKFAAGDVCFMLCRKNFFLHDLDKRKSQDVSGDWGTVTVNYSILSHSMNADVEITVTDSDGNAEEGLEVFGTISATQCMRNTGSTMDVTIFKRSNIENRVATDKGGVVPLHRIIVATPTAFKENAFKFTEEDMKTIHPDFWNTKLPQLIFGVDLWAKDEGGQVVEIARGEAQFNVKLTDFLWVPKCKTIIGENGRLVKVSISIWRTY